jgi:RHS repeat-associated protein
MKDNGQNNGILIWAGRSLARFLLSGQGAVSVTREQLTGLSPALLSRTVTITPDSTTTTVTRAFEPGTDIIAEIVQTGSTAPRVRRTLHGRELESAGPDAATLLAYDGFGRAVSRTVTNAAGTVSTTAVVYDTLGSAVTNETTYGTLTAVTTTGYDSQGRAVSQTDALGNAVFTQYNRLGQVLGQSGATYPVAYEYDTAGRRTSMRTFRDENDDGDVTQWRYDAATGLLTNKVYADGSHVAYTHTQNGKPLRTTWARGAWKENAYDALGQLASVTYSDATPDVYHAYDVFGRVAASSNAVARYEYVNSLSGIATNELVIVDTNTCALTRELGERRRLSALHVGNTPVYYGYDAENRLAVTSNDAFTVAYALTADGWDAGYAVILTNGLTITRAVTRDPHRRHLIGTITNAVNGTMANALSFGHDLLGRITNRNADTFGYNARSEVTSADIGSTASRYAYDSIGNNCWISVNAVTNTYTANALNQYSNIVLQSYGLQPYSLSPSYDADGNMTWDGKMWHAWDAENRLTRSEPGWDGSTNGARRVVNRYDHMSRLVETRVEMLSGRGAGYPFDPSQGGTWDTVETRTFIYDGWLPVLEKITRTGGVIETREHVWGKDLSGTRGGAGGVGGLLATRINDTWYFPLYDNNGNVTDYIDAQGATVAHREYGPFGETLAASGPMADAFSFWFSTKYLHHETGLYYYGYRFYSPKLMRWLNRDPIGDRGGLNEYGFVGNDPMNRWDYLGLWKKGDTIDGGRRRVYIRQSGDTLEGLATLLKLDLNEIHKWARIHSDGKTDDGKTPCEVAVPNVIVVFTSKPSWHDLPVSVVSSYRRTAESLSVSYANSGYKVIFSKHSDSVSEFKALWETSGIYGFIYAGHGTYPLGFEINRSFDGVVFPSEVSPPHKLGLGMFYACYSDNRGTGDYSSLGAWKDHIAVDSGAVYLGYYGLAWWWSDPNTENMGK